LDLFFIHNFFANTSLLLWTPFVLRATIPAVRRSTEGSYRGVAACETGWSLAGVVRRERGSGPGRIERFRPVRGWFREIVRACRVAVSAEPPNTLERPRHLTLRTGFRVIGSWSVGRGGNDGDPASGANVCRHDGPPARLSCLPAVKTAAPKVRSICRQTWRCGPGLCRETAGSRRLPPCA
jgi:hypothetical protein